MENIITFVKSEMSHINGHSFKHAKRVYELCKLILNQVNANKKIVLAAAWLHDCVDHKFYKNPQQQYEKIDKLLKDENYTEQEREKIAWIIGNSSFSKNVDLSDNIEAQVISDADKLDAIGALGLVRCIQYNTARGVDFEKDEEELKYFANMFKKMSKEEWYGFCEKLPERDSETPLYHIHRKMYKIPARLYTDFAKSEAMRRLDFLRDFLAEYFEENRATLR